MHAHFRNLKRRVDDDCHGDLIHSDQLASPYGRAPEEPHGSVLSSPHLARVLSSRGRLSLWLYCVVFPTPQMNQEPKGLKLSNNFKNYFTI